MNSLAGRRRAGLLVPLFSCTSTTSWGIGEIGDLAPLTAWMAGARLRVLQLLPLNEMAPDQQSPYSALSAMALDPLFIRLGDVPEFADLGGESSLSDDARRQLAEIRRNARVDYHGVRAVKQTALAAVFNRFHEREWCRDTERARAFKEFIARQAWWLEDYALFRAIHRREGNRPWTEWPDGLRRREPTAIDLARRELTRDVLFYQYLQWIGDTQWQDARRAAHANGVELYGDLPFMVDMNSADVWTRQHQFQLDASLGVPPDAFSATGQDWGMPVYRWDVIASDDFRWLRDRARRSADLYDGFRVDHLVGFYRTYGRPDDGREPFFTPATEPEQVALGEQVLGILREPGATLIAEDLGTVPDFVRASLTRLGVPGFRVFRWERLWHLPGHPFRDPADYPAMSVATTGTHDNEPLVVWWETAPAEECLAVADLPEVRRLCGDADFTKAPVVPAVRDVVLETLYASGSSFLSLPVQDVFGWRDRVNEPATVGDDNWTFRLPWPVDQLDRYAEAQERRDRLREWADRYGR